MGLQFTVTGQEVPALKKFDQAMETYMKETGIPCSQLAITRHKRLVFSRAYTFAVPWHPVTTPTKSFRIASCSKPITAILIHKLMETTQKAPLRYSDRMQDILKLQPPQGHATANDRWKDITVEHLLCHNAGIDRDWSDNDVLSVFGHDPPVRSRNDVASYAMTRKKVFEPGSFPRNKEIYSNLGYVLLSLIAQAKAQFSYEILARDKIFRPLGLARPRVGLPLISDWLPDEVTYRPGDPGPHPSVLSPRQEYVLNSHGNGNTAIAAAAGGWAMAAADYAKILAALDEDRELLPADLVTSMLARPSGLGNDFPRTRGWGINGTAEKLTGVEVRDHGGVFPGTAAYVAHRSDALSIAAFFNLDAPGDFTFGGANRTHDVHWNVIASSIAENDWPTHDLFPMHDIPPVKPHARSYFIKSAAGNVVLDVKGGNSTPGTDVIVFSLHSSRPDNQSWRLIPAETVTYGYIVSQLNRCALDVSGASAAAGTPVVVFTLKRVDAENQLWAVIPTQGKGTFFLRSRLNGHVLDIKGSDSSDGAPVVTFPQSEPPARNQTWLTFKSPEFTDQPMGLHRDIVFMSLLNEKVLDVKNASRSAGTGVVMFKQKVPSAKNQLWDFLPAERVTYFTVQSRLNGLVLDVLGATKASNTPVVAFTRHSPARDNQLWEVTEEGHLRSKLAPHLVLDIRGGRADAGTPVQIFSKKEGPLKHQLWTFEV